MGKARYVKKADDRGWDVVKEGRRRASGHGATKADALAVARKHARRDGGGEVLVLNRTGKVVDTTTVSPRRKRAAA